MKAPLRVRKLVPPLEKVITATIRRDLTMLGYRVFCTQQYRPRSDVHQGTTTSIGLPDLFVTHPRFGENTWRALEVKRPGRYGVLSDAQRELVEAGVCVVVTSTDEALKALGDPR